MTQIYDKEFKLNAVKLYLANTETIDKIAHDLGISRASLGHWIREYQGYGLEIS
jgi:transposase-like protein